MAQLIREPVFWGFLGTVVAANIAITIWGPVPVGFGLVAPAGVYCAGLAFTLRDLLHDRCGRRAVLIAIGAGAALSAALATPRFALASAVAFAVAEVADLVVYAPLRARSWVTAITLSNLVGLVLDSALFLWLAFGSFTFLAGQVVGKLWVTALAVFVLALWTRSISARPRQTG